MACALLGTEGCVCHSLSRLPTWLLLSQPVFMADLPTAGEIISSWSSRWEGGLSSPLQEKEMDDLGLKHGV